jgi:hypothetical protein
MPEEIMPKKKASQFTGVLAEPMPQLSRGLIRNDAEVAGALVRRTRALLLHYGIEDGPDAWMYLTLALARDFVPGFQAPSKRGQRNLYYEKRQPRAELLELREKHPELRALKSDRKASEWLARHQKLLPAYYQAKGKLSDDTIRNEIRAAKKNRAWALDMAEALGGIRKDQRSD